MRPSPRSINDLRGKAVGTIQVYLSRMQRYGISPVLIEFKVCRMGSQTALFEPNHSFPAASGRVGCTVVSVSDG